MADPCTSKHDDEKIVEVSQYEIENMDTADHSESTDKKPRVKEIRPNVFYVGHTVITDDYEGELGGGSLEIPCGTMGLLAMKMIFISVCFVALFNSLSMISNATGKAVIKEYSAYRISFKVDLTPIASLIALMITGILSVVTLMYISAAIWLKNHNGFIASIVLMVLLIIQAVFAATTTKVSTSEEFSTLNAMKSSFLDAKTDTTHHKFWRGLEHQFKCCGMKGPTDYFDPGLNITAVEASCCPEYETYEDTDLVTYEDFRQDCIRTKSFYDEGCGDYIIEAYIKIGQSLHDSTVTLVIFEFIISFIGVASCKLSTRRFLKRNIRPRLGFP